nr:hypothetical protein [Tanacetum cinerariifolium]
AKGNGDPPVPDLRTMEELCQPSLNGRGDDANKHLDKFLHVTQSIKVNGVNDDALRLHRDTINVAAGGTFMKGHPKECYDIIENITAGKEYSRKRQKQAKNDKTKHKVEKIRKDKVIRSRKSKVKSRGHELQLSQKPLGNSLFPLHYTLEPRKVKTHLFSSKINGEDVDPSLHGSKSKAKIDFPAYYTQKKHKKHKKHKRI